MPKVFASKYCLLLKRLEDNGTGYSATLVKPTFLSKISHSAYQIFKQTEMYNGTDFEEMLRHFHRKARKLRVPGQETRGDSNQKTVNNSNSKEAEGNKNKNKNKENKKKTYSTKEWNKMSKEEKQKVFADRKARKQAKHNAQPAIHQHHHQMPMQYGGHSMAANNAQYNGTSASYADTVVASNTTLSNQD